MNVNAVMARFHPKLELNSTEIEFSAGEVKMLVGKVWGKFLQ